MTGLGYTWDAALLPSMRCNMSRRFCNPAMIAHAMRRPPAARVGSRAAESLIDRIEAREAIDAIVDALDYVDLEDMSSPAAWAFDGEVL